VVFGAFGAHALKPLLSPHLLATFETGVRYQFYHTLAIILVAVLYQLNSNKKLKLASYFFFIGIFLFSGSLYLISLLSIFDMHWFWLGPITPLGGLSFMLGWFYLFLGVRDFK